jgi:hypothetical protein
MAAAKQQSEPIWSPAFVPLGDEDVDDRIHDLCAYAQVKGLRIVGVRIALMEARDGAPIPHRIKRILKFALRTLRLKCVDVRERNSGNLLLSRTCDDITSAVVGDVAALDGHESASSQRATEAA